jgi:exopolysaccharide production protein ExoQ
MPNAHNGYYDATLEMGHIGLTLLLVFILATLHAIGLVADRDPARAWLLLSLALFIICYNYFEILWVMFAFVAVGIGRYLQPVPLRRAAYRSRSPKPGGPGPLPGVQAHRLRARLS